MGLEFVRKYQGQSVQWAMPGVLEEDDNDEDKPVVNLDIEHPAGQWQAINSQAGARFDDYLPRRFIDGCHVAETVSWVRDAAGHALPVLLAEIGSTAMSIQGNQLRREFAVVDRILTMIVDPFPWHDVEDFARDLRRKLKYRLIPARQPEEGIGFEFNALRQHTHLRSLYEMGVLEQLALMQRPDTPTLIDGPLQKSLPGKSGAPTTGVIKTHREQYIDDAGNHLMLDLKAGQRTPAFKIEVRNLPVVSWYLKLADANNYAPRWGVVRVEIAESYFNTLPDPFQYFNALADYLLSIRCRQEDYARAAISLEPVVHAERSLRSLFSPMSRIVSGFYHATGL